MSQNIGYISCSLVVWKELATQQTKRRQCPQSIRRLQGINFIADSDADDVSNDASDVTDEDSESNAAREEKDGAYKSSCTQKAVCSTCNIYGCFYKY